MKIKDLKFRDLKKLAKKLKWAHKPLSPISNPLSTYRESLDATLSPTVILASEALQNAMDVGSPTITFEWTTLPTEILDLVGWSELMERGHKLADIEKLRKMETINCLVIRDEGPGLGGDYVNRPGAFDIPGNFAALIRSYGNSSKGAGNSGSKGIGSCFSLFISMIQAAIYITRREEDKKLLITGKNDMSIHEYRGEEYQYDGMLSVADDELPLPAEGELAESIAEALGMGFGENETGLCTLIPAITDDITPNGLIKVIIRDFFVPVIRRKIKVFVKSPDFDTVEISDDTIAALAADPKYGLSKDHSSILRSVYDAFDALDRDDIMMLDLGTERFTSESLDEDIVKSLVATLNDGAGAVGASIRFDAIRKGGGSEGKGRIDYGIMYTPGLSTGMEIQVRDGISLVKKKAGSPYVLVTVSGFGDPVAEMLRDGENTSHNTWSAHRMVKKGWETDSASAICSAFQRGANVLLKAVNKQEVQVDGSILADIFGMPDGTRPVGDNKKEKEAKDKSGAGEKGKATMSPTLLVSEPIEMNDDGLWGFKVRLNEEGRKKSKGRSKFDVTVSATYASSEMRTDQLRHSSSDFNLGDFKVVARGCEDHVVKTSSIEAVNVGPDFEVSVIGTFDENRELHISSDTETFRKNVKTNNAR